MTEPTISHYRITGKLGEGGMGVVYKAEDNTLRRPVALKLLARDSTPRPDQIERFRQEGRLASRISHPRCVFVYAADEEGEEAREAFERQRSALRTDINNTWKAIYSYLGKEPSRALNDDRFLNAHAVAY